MAKQPTPFDIHRANAQEWSRLADEHAAHSLAIYEINLRRNTLVPISILPEDILIKIFLLNAPYNWCNSTLHRSLVEDNTLSASQVCSRWRNIILGSSVIWSIIPNLKHIKGSWLEEYLRRSGTAALTVTLPFEHFKQQYGCAMNIHIVSQPEYVGRFQHLSSNLNSGNDILKSVLNTPMPLLVSLDLNTSHQEGDELMLVHPVPSLRHLHVHTLSVFKYYSLPFSSLRSLSIDLPLFSGYSVARFLPLLQQMKYIEALEITSSIHDIEPPTVTYRPVISLPYLSRLTTMGPTSDILSIFNSITIAESMSVRIEVKIKDCEAYQRFEKLVLILKRMLDCRRLGSLQQWRIISWNYTFSATLHSQSFDVDTERPILDICICFPYDTQAESYRGHVLSALKTFGFSHLCQLTWENYVDFDEDNILQSSDLIFAFTSVETMSLTLCNTRSFYKFFQMLRTNVASLSHSNEPVPQIPFPALKTLRLIYRSSHWPEDEDLTNTSSSSHLMEFLAWRQSMGLPINVLDLGNWTSIELDMEKFVEMDMEKFMEIDGLEIIRPSVAKYAPPPEI